MDTITECTVGGLEPSPCFESDQIRMSIKTNVPITDDDNLSNTHINFTVLKIDS